MQNQPITVKISMPKAEGFDRVTLVPSSEDADPAAVYVDHSEDSVTVELKPQ